MVINPTEKMASSSKAPSKSPAKNEIEQMRSELKTMNQAEMDMLVGLLKKTQLKSLVDKLHTIRDGSVLDKQEEEEVVRATRRSKSPEIPELSLDLNENDKRKMVNFFTLKSFCLSFQIFDQSQDIPLLLLHVVANAVFTQPGAFVRLPPVR